MAGIARLRAYPLLTTGWVGSMPSATDVPPSPMKAMRIILVAPGEPIGMPAVMMMPSPGLANSSS